MVKWSVWLFRFRSKHGQITAYTPPWVPHISLHNYFYNSTLTTSIYLFRTAFRLKIANSLLFTHFRQSKFNGAPHMASKVFAFCVKFVLTRCVRRERVHWESNSIKWSLLPTIITICSTSFRTESYISIGSCVSFNKIAALNNNHLEKKLPIILQLSSILRRPTYTCCWVSLHRMLPNYLALCKRKLGWLWFRRKIKFSNPYASTFSLKISISLVRN